MHTYSPPDSGLSKGGEISVQGLCSVNPLKEIAYALIRTRVALCRHLEVQCPIQVLLGWCGSKNYFRVDSIHLTLNPMMKLAMAEIWK